MELSLWIGLREGIGQEKKVTLLAPNGSHVLFVLMSVILGQHVYARFRVGVAGRVYINRFYCNTYCRVGFHVHTP